MTMPMESLPAGSPPAGSRHPRISFPPLDPSSDADSLDASIGLGPPPLMRRISTGLEVGDNGEYLAEGRRRIKSTNTAGALTGRPRGTPTPHGEGR